ncbi:MAG: hypothetical protein ACR2G3_01175 [Solirubrobacterales bacterium]
MKRRIRIGALIASGALAATTALVEAELNTKSADVELAAGQDGSATARCGAGTTAFSGGMKNPDYEPVNEGSAIYLTGLMREGRRRISAVGSNSGSASGTLIAHAYCDKSEPRLKTVAESKPVENEFTSVAARCERGSEAVWGGFASDGTDSILSLGSRRKGDRTWKAAAIQFGDPSTLTVFAYCAKREPGLKTKFDSVSVGADKLGTATAKCRKGQEAVSGGFEQPGTFGTSEGSEIYFYESHRIGDRRWTASGLNQGDPAILTAFAYCKR